MPIDRPRRISVIVMVTVLLLVGGCSSTAANRDAGSGLGPSGMGGRTETGGDGISTGGRDRSGNSGSGSEGSGGSSGSRDGGGATDASIDRPRDAGSCGCRGIDQPVCGADGHSYGNSCDADCVGIAVAYSGACKTPASGDAGSQTDGGNHGAGCQSRTGCCASNTDCPSDQECTGATCSTSGTTSGVCKSLPSVSGQCWQDSDCASPNRCTGQRICPCGSACFLGDSPGACGK
jgi:hypothetical protein